MTDYFLMLSCNVRYDHKPFEQVKSQILTSCVKQQRHRDFLGIRRTEAPKHHTKNKRTRQAIYNEYTLILI